MKLRGSEIRNIGKNKLNIPGYLIEEMKKVIKHDKEGDKLKLSQSKQSLRNSKQFEH